MTSRLVILALPLLAACASVSPTIPEMPLTKWRFVSIDGKPPVSAETSLEIFEHRIGANVGCNGMGGDLSLDEKNGRLIVGAVVSTQMYCEGIMDQERAVSELLGGSPYIFVENGRMALRSEGHIAELKRAD
jgi:heat shock protein HslJ